MKFQAGAAGAASNIWLKGNLELDIDNITVDVIPIRGNYTPVDYKLFFFNRILKGTETVVVEFYLNNHNLSKGDLLRMERISFGTDLGSNIQTSTPGTLIGYFPP